MIETRPRYAPTPPIDSNNTRIANTEWVVDKLASGGVGLKSPEPTYVSDVLTRVDYADGSYKTLTYTDGLVTQVDYVRTGFPTIRKTITYTDGVWAGTVESEI